MSKQLRGVKQPSVFTRLLFGALAKSAKIAPLAPPTSSGCKKGQHPLVVVSVSQSATTTGGSQYSNRGSNTASTTTKVNMHYSFLPSSGCTSNGVILLLRLDGLESLSMV